MVTRINTIPIGFPCMEHFGVGDIVLASAFVEEVKEPLDSRRYVFIHCEDGAEEIDNVFLNCAFGREETSEEDFGDSFGRTIHLAVRRPLFAIRLGVVHWRPHQMKRLQVVHAVFRITNVIAVLQDCVSQGRIEVISVNTYKIKSKSTKL